MADHDDDWILFRLQRLDPLRFEELCFALLKAKGHQDVRHLGAAGGEGGVDVLSVGPDGKRWVTQCKRYRRCRRKSARYSLLPIGEQAQEGVGLGLRKDQLYERRRIQIEEAFLHVILRREARSELG